MSTNIYKNNIKCAVFDLDGTLLNTIETITHYLNFALAKNRLPALSTEECKSFVGDGVKMLLLRAIESRGEYSDDLYKKMYDDYNTAYDREPNYLTKAYGGIFEMLCELKNRGIRLAVLSNKPHVATLATIGQFFPDTFDAVFGGRDGVPLKPDPTSLLSTISALDCTPEQCLYVGDSDVDMQTARNAGVAIALGVSWGYRSSDLLYRSGADLVINHPCELAEILFTKRT